MQVAQFAADYRDKKAFVFGTLYLFNVNSEASQWCQFKKNPTHKRLIVNSIQKML